MTATDDDGPWTTWPKDAAMPADTLGAGPPVDLEPVDPTAGWRPCAAKRSNQAPCRGPAMVGQRVCGAHGGKSPQAKHAAAERLALAADTASALLVKIIEDPREDTRNRLTAARELLDRVGISARHALEVSGPDGGALELLVTPDLAAIGARLAKTIAAVQLDGGGQR